MKRVELLLYFYVFICELEGLHNDEIPALVDFVGDLLAACNCGTDSLSADLAYSSPLQAGRHYGRRLIAAHQRIVHAAGKSFARSVGPSVFVAHAANASQLMPRSKRSQRTRRSIVNFRTRGFTSFSKSAYDIFRSSRWLPPLNAIS